MILIKDRHSTNSFTNLSLISGTMILIKDRHTFFARRCTTTSTENMILIKDRHTIPNIMVPPFLREI